MIIPHILDQFVWDTIICEQGAEPKGIRIDRMTPQNLKPKIMELLNNASYKKKAKELAAQMNKENFKEELLNVLLE
ncbi:MAG: hypothetical protein JW768_02595 [Chitinispirillaceae bacterium]|nr:hypothetical protein [Chitinispirillaceae bacterium]